MKIFTWYFIALLICKDPVFAQAGSHDDSFADSGKTILVSDRSNTASALLVQPDGKILIAGYTTNSYNKDFELARLNTDGNPDSSFGVNGKVLTDSGQSLNCFSAALQSDGKIVVGGLIYPTFKAAVQRFNNNGTFDTAFGVNGQLIIPLQDTRSGKGIALQPDGKILVAGSAEYYNYLTGVTTDKFMIIRITAKGTLDSSFGKNGMDSLSFGNMPQHDYANGIAVQADGKIIVSGNDDVAYALLVARINENGSVDSTFGKNGRVTTSSYGIPGYAAGMSLRSDGHIILGGYLFYPISFMAVEYNDNGTPDSSFNGNGIFSYPYNYNPECFTIAVQPDGKVLLAGTSNYNSTSSFTTLRIKENGSVDLAFGDSGISKTSFISRNATAYAIGLEPDGKIVLAGTAFEKTAGRSGDFAVARYLNDLTTGTLNFSTQSNSAFIYPNPIHATETLQYSLAQDENLSINLYDVNGGVVQSFFNNQKRIAGEHQEELNFNPALPAGNYVLAISNGKNRVSIKIIKE